MVSTTDKNSIKKSKIGSLSFEVAAKELEEIVEKLESGTIDLDQAIEIYKRGYELKNHCEKTLKNAKLKVEKVVQTDGKIELTETEDHI